MDKAWNVCIFPWCPAHFFSLKDHKRHNMTLVAHQFPSAHTANHIADLVQIILSEWHIPTNKIHRILTDNGSNKVVAFKSQFVENGQGNTDTSDDADVAEAETVVDNQIDDVDSEELTNKNEVELQVIQ